MLFALCDNGAILQICLHTMTVFFSWNDLPIKDFVVFEGNTTNECNLLVFVDEALMGYQDTAHLVLLSWPGITCKIIVLLKPGSRTLAQCGQLRGLQNTPEVARGR